MRILIVCNDTRGGVQPYAALARGLAAAGHRVSAVAPIGLTGLFDASVTVTPLKGTEEALAFASSGIAEQGTGAAMRLLARELPKRLGGWCQTVLEAADGVDVMTGGIGGMAIGLAVAERLNVPFIASHLQPVGHTTGAYPGVLFPRTPGWTGAIGRRISHHLSDVAVWLPFRSAMARVRREVFGLQGRPKLWAGLPSIYGFSRHVVPMTEGPLCHVTGYWSLPAPEGWVPPPALAAFLAGGKPVVSVGFGSMGAAAPLALAEMVVGAARAAGCGWSCRRSGRRSRLRPLTIFSVQVMCRTVGCFPGWRRMCIMAAQVRRQRRCWRGGHPWWCHLRWISRFGGCGCKSLASGQRRLRAASWTKLG